MNNIYPNSSLSTQEMNKRMILCQDELNKTKKALENSETKCEALEWKVNELHETTEKLLQRENASEYMSSNYQHIYDLENELENVSNRLIEAENEIQMYKDQFTQIEKQFDSDHLIKQLQISESQREALEWKVNEMQELTESLLEKEKSAEIMKPKQRIIELEEQLLHHKTKLNESEKIQREIKQKLQVTVEDSEKKRIDLTHEINALKSLSLTMVPKTKLETQEVLTANLEHQLGILYIIYKLYII